MSNGKLLASRILNQQKTAIYGASVKRGYNKIW